MVDGRRDVCRARRGEALCALLHAETLQTTAPPQKNDAQISTGQPAGIKLSQTPTQRFINTRNAKKLNLTSPFRRHFENRHRIFTTKWYK